MSLINDDDDDEHGNKNAGKRVNAAPAKHNTFSTAEKGCLWSEMRYPCIAKDKGFQYKVSKKWNK